MGVLGPDTSAHNPNELIDLDYARKIIKAISHVLGTCGEQQ